MTITTITGIWVVQKIQVLNNKRLANQIVHIKDWK